MSKWSVDWGRIWGIDGGTLKKLNKRGKVMFCKKN